MGALNEKCVKLLSTTTVPLNSASTAYELYTVPVGKTLVISHVDVIAGADAGASTVRIGRSTALTDFLNTQTLSNLDAAGDKVTLMPVPNATPVKQKTYAAGVIISIQVVTAEGGASNTVKLFGYLY